MPADQIDAAVIGLTNYRVQRKEISIARGVQGPFDNADGGIGNIQGIGQQDWGFDFPQFNNLRDPDDFTIPIALEIAGRDLLLIEIARMGQDGRDAGMHADCGIIQGDLADPNFRDVSQCIPSARGERSRNNAQITRPFFP